MADFRDLPVMLRLGKKGLSVSVLDEMKVHLKKRKIVKFRFLQSFPFQKDRKTEAARIAHMLESELMSISGNVFVLKK